MSWTDAIEDRWGSRQGTLRLAARLVGVGVFGYLLFRSGAFSGPLWVAVGTGLAIGLTCLLLVLRGWRPFGRATILLTAALMMLGIVLNPWLDGLGSVFFVIGGLFLVGRPEVPMRVGVGITGLLGIALVVCRAGRTRVDRAAQQPVRSGRRGAGRCQRPPARSAASRDRPR